MRLLVRLCHGSANGQTAWIVVLDHCDGDLRREIPHGTPCGVGIDVIVVAHRLTAKLFGVCEAVLVERIQIQRSLLVRVLAVTQHVRAVPRTGERGRELGLIHFGLAFGNRLFDGRRLRPMLRGPLVDGGVVGGRMGERLSCEPATLIKGEALAVLDAGGDECIIVRIGDDGDGGAVLGCATHHGRTADIDLFDGGGFVSSGADRVGERIQIDDHQIERLDAKLFQLCRVVLIGHVSENARVDMRVEGFDATVKALRKAGYFRDFRHLDAKFRKTLRSGTSGNHFSAGLDERFGKNLDAFLMEDRYQSPSYRSIRCCHPDPPCY